MIAPAGRWLGASVVLGRPVPVAAPYPHICRMTVTGLMTGVVYVVERRQCAACARPLPLPTPPTSDPIHPIEET
ncbi:hypothetical protein ACN261_31935 [Micromonospora sp. WMMD723]|uniref:hypothetical protein n=1 Tax=Micromonospora sp. WMMD723 TaxID=3403465 RepID=UPI003CF0EBD2